VNVVLPQTDPPWDIRREGRRWAEDEVWPRYDELKPRKIELIDAKLLWEDKERLTLLALLIENVGVDAVVRIGDPEV
jgi:hypothetical protein